MNPRTSALLYVRDGENYGVIASKGGAPKHPGWFHNLTNDPDVEIQVGARSGSPCAHGSPDDEERSRLWARADDVNKGQYKPSTQDQARTDPRDPAAVLEPRLRR